MGNAPSHAPGTPHLVALSSGKHIPDAWTQMRTGRCGPFDKGKAAAQSYITGSAEMPAGSEAVTAALERAVGQAHRCPHAP